LGSDPTPWLPSADGSFWRPGKRGSSVGYPRLSLHPFSIISPDSLEVHPFRCHVGTQARYDPVPVRSSFLRTARLDAMCGACCSRTEDRGLSNICGSPSRYVLDASDRVLFSAYPLCLTVLQEAPFALQFTQRANVFGLVALSRGSDLGYREPQNRECGRTCFGS